MYREIGVDSTDTEEEVNKVIENSLRDVSLSSIKTQDSIENNSIVINLEEEEHKEGESDRLRMAEFREHRIQLTPFLSLKETQQEILVALAAPRVRLEVKPLHEIFSKVHKLTEDFQEWRKQD